MALAPGGVIGILGGGQLGRMTAMAARELGYRIHVLDPYEHCPARGVIDHFVLGAFDDVERARELASGCGVVTLEIEQIALDGLRAAQASCPVRPGPEVLRIIQDRGRQRRWLQTGGFPVGPHRHATSAAELKLALEELQPKSGNGHFFIKAVHGGYDGRGQVEVTSPSEADDAFRELGGAPSVVELGLDLEMEVSVMVARRPGGEMAVFPPAKNHHENRILAWSVLPAPIDPALATRATELAKEIASAIDLQGLLAVELFCTRQGELLVNELAPRPHNSFHGTQAACPTSQFGQLVRAVCDLPLGSTELVRPTAIANLLGDLWVGAKPPGFEAALSLSGVSVHLYGKRDARPGRKMGHLTASAATCDEAIALVHEAEKRVRASIGGV